MPKRLAMVLIVLFTLGVGSVWGETATLTLSASKKFGTTSGSTLTDDKSNTWKCVGTNIQNTYNNSYSGQQFGTAKNSGTYTFTCTIADASISSVKIKAAAGNTNSTYSISVGGKSKYSGSLSKTSTTYGGTNASGTGEISISLTGSSVAVYLGSIEVIYATTPTCINPTISWATEPANGEIGNTMTASVTTNYSAGLTYSSGNTTVATIDNSGKITYKAAGSTTITAKVTGDGNTYCDKTVSVTKTINVTCGSKVTINTTSDGHGTITANPTSIETCSDNDGDRQITITLYPNSHYSSNAPTISGITNATITGSGNTYTIQLPKGSNGTLSVSATFKEDDKYTVIWSADDATIYTEQVYVNEKVSVVPTISDIPEENRCGDKFVGWTTEAIPTPQDDAPGYFTTAANSPKITKDITFYAVFADYKDK